MYKASPIIIILLSGIAYIFSLIFINIQRKYTKIPYIKQEVKKLFSASIQDIICRPTLLRLIIETNAINLIFSTIIVLNPALITAYFHQSNSFLAIVSAIFGAIGLFFSLSTPFFLKKYRRNYFSGFCIIISIISTCIVGSSLINVYLYIIFAGLIIGIDSAFSIYLRVERAQAVEAKIFQRIIPMMMLCNAIAFPLSSLLITLLSPYMEPFQIMFVMSGLSLFLFVLSKKVNV